VEYFKSKTPEHLPCLVTVNSDSGEKRSAVEKRAKIGIKDKGLKTEASLKLH
jgi:hypothetical protein